MLYGNYNEISYNFCVIENLSIQFPILHLNLIDKARWSKYKLTNKFDGFEKCTKLEFTKDDIEQAWKVTPKLAKSCILW